MYLLWWISTLRYQQVMLVSGSVSTAGTWEFVIIVRSDE